MWLTRIDFSALKVLLPLILAVRATAGTFELNSVKGLWPFTGDLQPYWGCQSAAVASGFTIDGPPGAGYRALGNRTWLDLRSDSPPYGGLAAGESLIFPHAALPNGPPDATNVNAWTVMMDVRIPTNAGCVALLRHTWLLGSSDVFLNLSRQIVFSYANGPAGPSPVASDPLPTNAWVRLAFSSRYDSGSGHVILRAYVDGVETAQSASGGLWADPEDHYALNTTAFSLFSEHYGNTGPVEVNSVAFWDLKLSNADIASLGGSDADGINWPDMTPADGWPPLPPLNGTLMFGAFETRYTPDMAAIAATAEEPSEPGAIADVLIEIGEGEGQIPGMPEHSFGPIVIEAYILPDGTAVSYDPVLVSYAQQPADDVDVLGDVTLVRTRTIQLTPEGAKGDIDVYLPAGFGVSDGAQNALLRDHVRVYDAPLGAELVPTNEVVELTSAMFGYGAGATLYPVLDRVPVRFSTQSLAWHPLEGSFRFEQTHGPYAAYTRVPQLTRVAAEQAEGLPGAAIVPPSNDGYFIAAGVPDLAPVVVMARPGGAALVEALTLSLDATALGGTYTGFATHYPLMSVRWTGTESRLCFTNDAIDRSSSRLYGPLPSLTSYRRAVPDDSNGCANASSPIADENIFFDPGAEGLWFFTPDGGLYAYGNLSSTPVFDRQSLTPEWGGFRDKNDVLKFAHAVVTNDQGVGGFSQGYVLTSGTAVRNNAKDVEVLSEDRRSASILLTGFGDECAWCERPGTPDFENGLAYYPGVNLRVSEGADPYTAKSILAGVEISPPDYDLSTEARYCIRPGGVNGLHIAAADSEQITFQAYGSDFRLTRLILSYRDGRNIRSGVGGSLSVKSPADFQLVFAALCLGAKGELKAAEIAEGQSPTLGPSGRWDLKFTPLTLDFPQPDVCPPPDPDEGFIRVGVTAKLPGIGGQFTGNLGLYDGNIVTESLPVGDNGPIAAGTENVSRFATDSLLTIAGTEATGGKAWSVNPVTGISVNRWVDDASSQGTLTVGGLLDLPFFVDMPVVLSTGSKNTEPNFTPQLYVRSNKNWDPLEGVVFDPAHLGFPAVTTLYEYRRNPDYDPVATRDWQDLVSFALPVRMEEDRVIRSRAAVSEQTLMLFNLTEAVRSMTPDSAEITLDGRLTTVLDELTKQVNVGTLLGNSTLDGAEPELQNGVDSALDCVRALDGVLADHSHPLLDPGLALLARQEADDDYFQYLKAAPNQAARKDRLDDLVGNSQDGLSYWVTRMLAPDNSEPGYALDGRWRRDIEQPVTDACKGLEASMALVADEGRVLALAQALAQRMGLPWQDPGGFDDSRRAAISLLFAQAAQRLNTVETELDATSGMLTIGLQLALGDISAVSPIVQQALDDLKPRWAPADPAQADALFNAPGAHEAFVQDLSLALADRFAGSAFAASCGTLLRQYLSDPQTLARQALDDTLRMACTLVADTAQEGNTLHANGKLHDYLKADNLCGYARICGDSLHELRLDGKLTLHVGDSPLPQQEFDGWCLLRDVDSGTPGTDGISEGDIAAEIVAGATTQLKWGEQYADMTLGAKVGLNSAGSPVSFMGDMALDGSIDLSAIAVNNLKLGIGMGPDDAYFYGRAGGKIASMPVAAGVFFGKTSDIEILKNADRDIAGVLTQMSLAAPITGGLVYGEGQVSLMPLIGIPPSCLLDLRLGGGQGFFVFVDDASKLVGGFKIVESVSGELLCICDVTGRFGSVLAGAGEFGGSDVFTLSSLNGRAWATLEGEVGYDPFSYTFEKSVGISLEFDNGGLSWDVDY